MRDADGDSLPLSDPEIAALFAPFDDATLIALAVSGGADSLALMCAAARWRMRKQGRPQLLVLTVDHRLRRGSGKEAANVVAAAEARGLAAQLLVRRGGAPEGDIEAAARRARYRLLFAAARAAGASHLLTAHHRDDVAETFLMRRGRGAGVFGLAAMRPAIDVAGIVLARPLLAVPRARLAATTRAAGLVPVVDPMNADPRFARARIRAGMPGQDAAALAATATHLAATADAIDAAANALIAAAVTVDAMGLAARLDAAAFRAAPEAVADRVLVRLLIAIGGEDYPPRYPRLMAIAALLRTYKSGRLKRTLAGTVVEARGDGFVFYRESGRSGLPAITLKPGARAVVWDHRFRLMAPPTIASTMNVRALGEEGCRALKLRSPSVPTPAFATLPAVFRRGRLVGLADAAGVEITPLLPLRLSTPPLFPVNFAEE